MKAIYNTRDRLPQTLDRATTGKSTATIRKFCEEHSSIPRDEGTAYCIGFDTGDLTYFAFSCPSLLLANAQGPELVITCDHTDGLCWLGLVTLIIGSINPKGEFKTVCFALTTNKKTKSTAAIFDCVKLAVVALGATKGHQVGGNMEPRTIVADGAEYFTKAYERVAYKKLSPRESPFRYSAQ
ncbi:hypothetical protein Pmar_PMAR004836 [Perkinsus marinus ATCC 50983]|uniref:MULE transposase domain-containing protein n=1 Tax=Perkinsus marinus (strain ATCC 50983 / TXsc) TaxID=423536 RepID=C5LLB4_PERM5|nr:hypothetical protein Pmar_PMAR004836 [Perkinsus marinus ATCC 50983]EER02473.1 hypothetical protein Pmar_PMAR004836 [Perkinsus marinus ATCC 50983]|eukprot:XP_002769755.1 hypothetical protein Pmar_PMAR004836 [Perkinsus marinus ATCC 50983]